MSIPVGTVSRPALPRGLRFSETVDRALIHRQNPGEAFLTDAARAGPRRFAAAAVLPVAHPHYAAHTGPSRNRDPMLLLECARQAVTYAAHTMFGLEADAYLVVRSWSADFAEVAARADVAPRDAVSADAAARELVMTATVDNVRLVRDRLRGLDYELDLWLADAWAARVRMEIGCLSAAAYAVVRSRKHDETPPSSADLADLADLADATGVPVPPDLVGRIRTADALLLDVAAGPRTVTAGLRVPADNPSLFDHAQDHVPGMVLVEAARQLAALATEHWGGPGPHRTQMVALTSSFATYAELREPVLLTALPSTSGTVTVTFRQTGADIAHVDITMAAGSYQPGRR